MKLFSWQTFVCCMLSRWSVWRRCRCWSESCVRVSSFPRCLTTHSFATQDHVTTRRDLDVYQADSKSFVFYATGSNWCNFLSKAVTNRRHCQKCRFCCLLLPEGLDFWVCQSRQPDRTSNFYSIPYTYRTTADNLSTDVGLSTAIWLCLRCDSAQSACWW